MSDEREPPKPPPEKPPHKTFEGFMTPGVDESPRERSDSDAPDGTHTAPDAHLEARFSPDESGELYLPPGTVPSQDVLHDVPLVEIEVVHQHGPAPRMEQPAQVLEVWTQNRIYLCDAQMICIGVSDRRTESRVEEHPFLGYKLVGGQHRKGDTFEISYPYPRPGTEAVFEHPADTRGHFSRTSTVTRVILRLHLITVAPSKVVPTWTHITAEDAASARPGSETPKS